uniref:CobW C-terminal domain-containing protein n=1 Tax=Proboscia inermis TaxID=420281 RepID=A0A7S0C7F1_9STRA
MGDFDDEVEWKEGEVRDNRFVFIGKNLKHDFYREGFRACFATPENSELRFPIGATVEANVGVFQKGTVVKHWDNGNAYRIEIEDGNKSNVWAPIDHDAYIRVVAVA